MPNIEKTLELALARHRRGDIAGARRLYDEILAEAPDHAEALHLSGVAALQSGQAAEAQQLIERAIALGGESAKYLNNLGEAAKAQGCFADALRYYRKARALDPDFAVAANNEGAAHLLMGQAAAAVPCLQDAVRLDPQYIQARLNLAAALRVLDDARGALAAFSAAMRIDPGNLTARHGFAATAAYAPDHTFDQNAREALADTIQMDGVDIDKLVRPALSILTRAGFLTILAETSDDEILAGRVEIDQPLSGPVFINLLERSVVADTAYEAALTRLRRATLMATVQDRTGLIERLPRVAAALALQSLQTDFAYAVTPGEDASVDRLIAELDSGDGSTPPETRARRIVAVALYRPIAEFAFSDALERHTEFSALYRAAVVEPREEVRLARDVPALTGVQTASAKVQEQYEASPYPRWTTINRRTPELIADHLGALFPGLAVPAFARAPVRALVAGCGTGKHAFDVAMAYRVKDLLAIDLSRRSLAYAQRMAKRLGIPNIRFALADLTLLAGDDRFHVIEAAGVLHHTADPEASWRRLVELLEPGGFMKVGLYSAAARRDVLAAQELVRPLANNGITAETLRAGRQAILELPIDDQRRRVARFGDFYSLTGVRDLLFNTIEHRFTLPQIADTLARLGLTFVGFQFDNPSVISRFLAAYPQARLDDLDLWHAFEQTNPRSFAGMYQFWCRKTG